MEVRISVQRSVKWSPLCAIMDTEWGGCEKVKEGTEIRLEVCGATGMDMTYILEAINSTLERMAWTARLILTRESVLQPRYNLELNITLIVENLNFNYITRVWQ